MKKPRNSSLDTSGRLHEMAEPVLNLTSLIDVVFVVLIMFIVIAPLLDVDSVVLAEGSSHLEGSGRPLLQAAPISIVVDAENHISFNKKALSLPQLQVVLQHIHQKHPEVRPQLFHDKKAFFGTYQSVKNAVEMAGFKELDVILMPGA